MKYFYKVERESGSRIGVYDSSGRGGCKYCGGEMKFSGTTVSRRPSLEAPEIPHMSDSYTDDLRFCYQCGWWEYYMREPWTATAYEGTLLDFKNEDETIRSVKGLLEEVATGKKEVRQASPRQFEEIAYAYFRDSIEGSVELTIPSRDGGFDLWCVDSKIGSFIVEAKRYHANIGVSIVRHLLGVMVYNDVNRGIIFHASALTRDSEKFVSQISKRGEWKIESRSTEDIMAWLKVSARDYDPDVLWSHIKGLSLNGNDFTVPREFLDPRTYEKLTK